MKFALLHRIWSRLFGFIRPSASVVAAASPMAVSASSIMEPLPSDLYSQEPAVTPAKSDVRMSRQKRTFDHHSVVAHPTNSRKLIVDGVVMKMAHRQPMNKRGEVAYVRPHHPNGPRRFVPPRLTALVAA